MQDIGSFSYMWHIPKLRNIFDSYFPRSFLPTGNTAQSDSRFPANTLEKYDLNPKIFKIGGHCYIEAIANRGNNRSHFQ